MEKIQGYVFIDNGKVVDIERIIDDYETNELNSDEILDLVNDDILPILKEILNSLK